MEEHEIQKLIDQIRNPVSESKALTVLLSHLSDNALTEAHFLSLVDVVLLPTLSSHSRQSLLKSVLIPPRDLVLPRLLLNKLLAVIGPPEVYIRSGKKCKLKRLPIECQLSILDWLFDTIPFYGNSIFLSIQRTYPILFSLLPYEYCRRHITSLIAIGAFNQGIKLRNKLKNWHMDFVNDLLKSSPHDPSLSLLKWILCKAGLSPGVVDPVSHEWPFEEEIALPIVEVHGNMIEKVLNRQGAIQSDVSKKISAVWEAIKLHQNDLLIMTNSRKRKKLSKDSFNEEVICEATYRDMSPKDLKDVAQSFSNLKNQQFSMIIDAKPSYQRLYLVSKTLTLLNPSDHSKYEGSQSIKELFETVEFLNCSVLDNIRKLANYGLFYNSQATLMLKHIEENDKQKQLAKIRVIISLIPYLNFKICNEIVIAVLDYKELIAKEKLLSNLFTNIILSYSKASNFETLGDNRLKFEAFPFLFLFVTEYWSLMGLRCQLSFIRLLRYVISIFLTRHKYADDIIRLIPPSQLTYQLLLSTNPLIVSEFLGLISNLKSFKLSEGLANHKKLINCLVYDSVNFIWKDLAFKYECSSFSKGMYFDPNFVHNMGRLNFFGSSNFLMLKTVGGISRNPAFAYMCAEIVWSLEDAQDDISVRHPGPLSEESVFRVQTDPENSWVQISYKDLKNDILQQLVDYGFIGLGAFLFSSIRSLRSRRQKTPS